MAQDPWKILRIAPTKDQKVIDYAWRKLAGIHHPDRGGDSEVFKVIRSAYEQALSISSKTINVKKATRTHRIQLVGDCSDFLEDRVWELRWLDEMIAILTIEVTLPAWRESWGRTRTMVIKDIKSSQNRPYEILLEIEIRDNELAYVNDRDLIWSPLVDLEQALKDRCFTARLGMQDVQVKLDNHGNGILQSHGFVKNNGDRADILVRPQYVWPLKNE
jgi:hypothetical protein